MLRFALANFHGPKFSTKISTPLVEIFDGFRDGNLTSEDHLIECHRQRGLISVLLVIPGFSLSADMANAFGVRVYPHVWGTRVALAAALQLIATLPDNPSSLNPTT